MGKGEFGEKLAAKYLENKGYQIIYKNFRTKFSEIDIISEHDDYLVFVEVKYRTNKNFGRAEDSINIKKIIKIEKAAEVFINNIYNGNKKNFRIDVIAINNFEKLEITHYKNVSGG